MRMRKIDRARFENRDEVVINNKVVIVKNAYMGLEDSKEEKESKVVVKKQ